MGSERDETYTILVKGKPLASVKADLIHAFLSVSLTSEIFILATPDRCTDLAFDASCVALLTPFLFLAAARRRMKKKKNLRRVTRLRI